MLEKPLVYLSNSIEKLTELLGDMLFSIPIPTQNLGVCQSQRSKFSPLEAVPYPGDRGDAGGAKDRDAGAGKTQVSSWNGYNNGEPFAKKFVFLPSASLKNPLMTRFVSGGKVKVAMGVDFLELGSGIQTLYQWVTGKTLLFPPLDLLALHLESLDLAPGLALNLAKEFLRYGKFGGTFLKKWPETWQKEYWDKAFAKWNYPYELLEAPISKPKNGAEVHLFNFPFLPKLYHLFFAKLAPYFPIRYYQFSPCREFWSDTVTDFERIHLLEKDPQLSLYFEEGNPLLNNLGRLGRETFRIFEEEDFTSEEHYVEKQTTTDLSRIQNEILNFRKGERKQDGTILLLPAASKQREVELLYTKLLEMDVSPSSIQVFAPDISLYAPFIELIFGAEDSPFDFSIRDLPAHPLFQAFFDLLTLNDHRFDVPSLLKLFSSPYFSPFSEKEGKEWRRWIKKSGVKWGVDKKHRKRLLPGILDETENGTWEEAFDQLLTNMIFIPEKGSEWDLPYLDFSDGELLGKGITLIRSLRADLDYIQEATISGGEWADCLMTLFNRYFSCHENEFAPFEEKISLLRELEGPFSFPSIKRYLASQLKEKKGVRQAKQLEAIPFCSLKPGVLSSSKVIALLGMEEGSFPRPYLRSSLNLLGKEGDYSPIVPDEDRYLFLQLLCSAEEVFLMTYQNISEEDGKEKPPSILVQELAPKIEKHPPFPFHSSYFVKPGKVYPKKQYEMAQTFYGPKKEDPFIPEFLHPTPLPKVDSFSPPSIEDLSRFAKNPLRFYFNHTLNLYLHYEEGVDEEFFLSPLQSHKLLNEETALEEADEKGHLPLGRFKEMAQQKIIGEWASYSPGMAEEGHSFMCTGKLEELVRIYPQYLSLYLKNPKPLVALKTGEVFELKSDPEEAFEDYLTYYHIACQTPSPLHPQFVYSLLQKDGEAFAKRIQSARSDPYLKVVFSNPSHYDPDVIFNTWAPLLRKTFAPLLEMINETV